MLSLIIQTKYKIVNFTKILKLIAILQITAYAQGIDKTATLIFILKESKSGESFDVGVKSEGMRDFCQVPTIKIGRMLNFLDL